MTKMATMPIYGKNALKSIYSVTNGLCAIELGMLHLGLMPVMMSSNMTVD